MSIILLAIDVILLIFLNLIVKSYKNNTYALDPS